MLRGDIEILQVLLVASSTTRHRHANARIFERGVYRIRSHPIAHHGRTHDRASAASHATTLTLEATAMPCHGTAAEGYISEPGRPSR